MKSVLDLVSKGGPVMYAILTLSVVLYSRCFKLLLSLRQSRRRLNVRTMAREDEMPPLRLSRDEVRESFRQQRVALAAMVAAAPLLGLLGTVSGMVRTFESLSSRTSRNAMEGLARGISEVLVATESGLIVAIPALLVIHLAHRELRVYLQRVNEIERTARVGAAS
jgi:biopolymer transport protein ExbB